MKKFVFSVASTATGSLQIKPSGSGDENVVVRSHPILKSLLLLRKHDAKLGTPAVDPLIWFLSVWLERYCRVLCILKGPKQCIIRLPSGPRNYFTLFFRAILHSIYLHL